MFCSVMSSSDSSVWTGSLSPEWTPTSTLLSIRSAHYLAIPAHGADVHLEALLTTGRFRDGGWRRLAPACLTHGACLAGERTRSGDGERLRRRSHRIAVRRAVRRAVPHHPGTGSSCHAAGGHAGGARDELVWCERRAVVNRRDNLVRRSLSLAANAYS